jgi:hypothetical protein
MLFRHHIFLSNGILEIGISLSNLIDSIDEQIGVVQYDNSINSKAQFEYHGTFRVINNPNLDKFLKVTHIGKLVSIRNNDQVVRIAATRFIRIYMNLVAVKEVSFTT